MNRNGSNFGGKSFGKFARKSSSKFDIKSPRGSSSAYELGRAQAWHEPLKPKENTGNADLVSDYNFSSTWSRWRRGFALSASTNQTLSGITFGFKLDYGGPVPAGSIGGIGFMYPTMRADSYFRLVAVRPRDTWNFEVFNNPIAKVTVRENLSIVEPPTPKFPEGQLVNYPFVYAVEMASKFGAPGTYLNGEVMSDRIRKDGTQKAFGFGNYTVIGVGIDGTFSFAFPPNSEEGLPPLYNTLFLAGDKNHSWEVVSLKELAIPAVTPPTEGDFLTTELRAQCSCPDFLGREGLNLWKNDTQKAYPYDKVQYHKEGFFYAGPGQTGGRADPNTPTQLPDTFLLDSRDDPGFVRDRGFIYLNNIYNISEYTEAVYSDPNLFYYQPRWCKHIYAAYWDMQNRFGRKDTTNPWVFPQPNDEAMDPYYREYFNRQLAKENTTEYLVKRLEAYERYSPSMSRIAADVTSPTVFNTMVKTLNYGRFGGLARDMEASFKVFRKDEFDAFDLFRYNAVFRGGKYRNGVLTTEGRFIYEDGQYRQGAYEPFKFLPSILTSQVYENGKLRGPKLSDSLPTPVPVPQDVNIDVRQIPL